MPVTVIVNVPEGVVAAVVTVSVASPPGVSGLGLKEALAPSGGGMFAWSVIASGAPATTAACTAYVAGWPAVTVWLAGETLSAKSFGAPPVGTAATVYIATDVVFAPSGPSAAGPAGRFLRN